MIDLKVYSNSKFGHGIPTASAEDYHTEQTLMRYTFDQHKYIYT